MREALILAATLILLLTAGTDTSGYCTFPQYLWDPMQDGSDRKWISRTEYVGNSRTWTKQKQISVKRTEIIVHHKLHASCDGYEVDAAVPCFRQDIVYKIICISEEPDNKFRVQQQSGSDRFVFSCLQFHRRSSSIVQVYSAVPKEVNEDRLCYDVALQRDEWPWVSPEHTTWTPCPLRGGFDFRAYGGESKEERCSTEWRPSHMESECIPGEGVTFSFPAEECSPFKGHITETRLECRGSWEEGSHHYIVLAESGVLPKYVMVSYIVLAESGVLPKYVMRLPRSRQSGARFTALLYFSVVVPLSGRGSPPGDTFYLELQLTRSGQGACYDESEQCPQLAAEGRCKNSALPQFANHCKLSCGLCSEYDFTPSDKEECRFPETFWGDWVTFREDGEQTVSVAAGRFTTSLSGSYVCKGTHWEQDFFKVLSTYTNGCRPRYTCLHLLDPGGGIPQFRMSASALTDQSFNICHFADDPPPVNDRIRSRKLKNLFPTSRLEQGRCGLGGIVHVNVTFSDNVSCDGTMADINKITCRVRPIARLEFHKCPHGPTGYKCVAFAHLPQGTSFLVTKLVGDVHQTRLQCWVVKTGSGRVGSPWKEVYQFNRVSCQGGDIIPLPADTHQVAAIETFDDRIEKPCDVHQGGGGAGARNPGVKLFQISTYAQQKGPTQGRPTQPPPGRPPKDARSRGDISGESGGNPEPDRTPHRTAYSRGSRVAMETWGAVTSLLVRVLWRH